MSSKEKELVTEEFCLRKDTYNMHEGGNGGFAHIRNSPKYKEYCRKGGLNSPLAKNPLTGTQFVKGDPRVKMLSMKANEHRKKYGLSEEHKRKIAEGKKRFEALKRASQK